MIYRKIFFHHSKRITHQYSFMTYINKPTKNTYQEYLPRKGGGHVPRSPLGCWDSCCPYGATVGGTVGSPTIQIIFRSPENRTSEMPPNKALDLFIIDVIFVSMTYPFRVR